MWFFPVFFFAYQFILRLWPGLMMPQIMAQFSIDARQFGIIAAFYYYGYASMQIPVAVLLDRFGARVMVFAFAVLCGVATVMFTYSDNWIIACLSRFLIGAGSAVGFLGVSKVISEWFPANQYTRMVGLSFSVGLMGAIYGGKPISVLVESYQWRNVALTLAALSILIGCSALLLLRSPAKSVRPQSEPGLFGLAAIKSLLSSPTLWMLAVANLLMVGALEGFSDVWGVSYLMKAYALSKNEAAQCISFIFFGMLFGGPLLAWCSKSIGNYSVLALCGLGMCAAFMVVLLDQHLSSQVLAGLFFAVGVMCCYQVVVFAAGAELSTWQQLGLITAFLNCINMLGGSFFHTLIGQLMNCFWDGTMSSEGSKLYSLSAYQHALMIIPVCAAMGVILIGLLANFNRRVAFSSQLQ